MKEVRIPESACVLSALMMDVSQWSSFGEWNSRNIGLEVSADFLDIPNKRVLARRQYLAKNINQIRELLQLGI